MSTFLLRRPVDWSSLTNGFHIPTEFHPLVYAMPGGELHHGDKRGVRILIDGEEFIQMWQDNYAKMSDEDKNMLPLKHIAFVGTNE